MLTSADNFYRDADFIFQQDLAHCPNWESSAQRVLQSPASAMAPPGDNAIFHCSMAPGFSMSSYTMAWYRQAHHGAPVEFLIKEYEKPTEKFHIVLTTEKNTFSLHLSDLKHQDSSIYYCSTHSYCDNSAAQAYFGAGTKLTVLVKLLNHSSEEECTEKRVTLVCLAEDFYPDHIDLAWYIDDKEESTGVAKDDSAKLNTDSNTYSISSRLSIPFKKWNQGNTYKCKVTFHYPKEKSNDGKWTTESSTRWESLTAPKRKSLHFFTFHRW
uniref:Ig-like domain-containing protein n=1 Tax=Astyanax mexicanus TaxID=7994 RepID=A0A8B9L929_ASTMX